MTKKIEDGYFGYYEHQRFGQYFGDRLIKVVPYHHGNPKFWEQGWWNNRRNDIGEVLSNWIRFCNDFKVVKVFHDLPTLKFLGTRSYELERMFDGIRCSSCRFADHSFGIQTADGKYYLVGSNYNGNGELDALQKEYTLGVYKGFAYKVVCEVLPLEYRFHFLEKCDPKNDYCYTVLWHCEKNPLPEKNLKKFQNEDEFLAAK